MLSIIETAIKYIYPSYYSENLNEMATVCRDNRNNLMVQVNPDRTRPVGSEYFKFYDATSFDSAKKFARIGFRRPEYVIHKAMYGKKRWFLNNGEKEELMDLLNSQHRGNNGLTNWQKAIIDFNNEKGLDEDKTRLNLLAARQLPYPNYLPFDLQMPDYRQLSKK